MINATEILQTILYGGTLGTLLSLAWSGLERRGYAYNWEWVSYFSKQAKHDLFIAFCIIVPTIMRIILCLITPESFSLSVIIEGVILGISTYSGSQGSLSIQRKRKVTLDTLDE